MRKFSVFYLSAMMFLIAGCKQLTLEVKDAGGNVYQGPVVVTYDGDNNVETGTTDGQGMVALGGKQLSCPCEKLTVRAKVGTSLCTGIGKVDKDCHAAVQLNSCLTPPVPVDTTIIKKDTLKEAEVMTIQIPLTVTVLDLKGSLVLNTQISATLASCWDTPFSSMTNGSGAAAIHTGSSSSCCQGTNKISVSYLTVDNKVCVGVGNVVLSNNPLPAHCTSTVRMSSCN
ncbi:MAG: hypothetical protein JWO06_2402 [Bacteroidota bacterium]|nr:hypothetical protein [Bacteroidota bacterium]